MGPLAEADPEDRKGARAETPAPEAAAWLANPDKPREQALSANMRYINWLANQPEFVGPWPAARDVYRDRSPITHADSIAHPLLLLQGLDDKVVPPSQSEAIVEALKQRSIPYAYIAFEGEGHGFRKAENMKRANEAHLSFLAQVSGFELADEFDPIQIENLDEASTRRRRTETRSASPTGPSSTRQ